MTPLVREEVRVDRSSPVTIRVFQKRLYIEHGDSVSLPQPHTYLCGNSVQPVVPLHAALETVLLLGAYPSARSATVGAERDRPVADLCLSPRYAVSMEAAYPVIPPIRGS